MVRSGLGSLSVEIGGQVATVRIAPLREVLQRTPPADIHWELQLVLNDLREDHSVRVIVLTGETDGEFCVVPPTTHYGTEHARSRLNDPAGQWKVLLGVIRLHTTMAEIEKPIVAKVNGDAIGFGQSIMFSCDLIVAREDAVVNDVHLAQGELTRPDGTHIGPPFGIVPGDGAGATIPLFMSPVKAKEYLMLAQSYTAKELAEMDCINYAVPLPELDRKVDEIVQRLLSRSAFALAYTKRIASRHVVDQLNRSLDAAAAYEFLNMMQIERRKFVDVRSLE